jgi:two-component system chemotaxis response regulator CheB
MLPAMIRVLVVDDSRTHRAAIARIIERAPGFQLAGTAEDGEQGVEMVHKLKPDIVLMDVNMPKLDGMGATERIMAEKPTPILLMTASENLTGEVDLAYKAIEHGALELMAKPRGLNAEDKETQDLLQKLKLLAGVPVISHLRGRRPAGKDSRKRSSTSSIIRRARKIVAIGASTGGPRALRTFLAGLPADLGATVTIVQHIDGMFVDGLVRWLGEAGPIPVSVAEEGRSLHENEVLVAPAGRHMEIAADRRITLKEAKDGGAHCPSADHLLRSAAWTYGPRAIGIVLTGMGEDGARGLLSIREAGGVTFAQDEATSVVYGMPRAAKELGAASFVLPIQQIAEAVARTCRGV